MCYLAWGNIFILEATFSPSKIRVFWIIVGWFWGLGPDIVLVPCGEEVEAVVWGVLSGASSAFIFWFISSKRFWDLVLVFKKLRII